MGPLTFYPDGVGRRFFFCVPAQGRAINQSMDIGCDTGGISHGESKGPERPVTLVPCCTGCFSAAVVVHGVRFWRLLHACPVISNDRFSDFNSSLLLKLCFPEVSYLERFRHSNAQ